VCGFAGLQALFDIAVPTHTAVCVLADKEEVGSMGVTGMQSAAFDTFMNDLCDGQGVLLRECYENSFCLSSDVTAAYDPNFAEVYEKRNSARINYGLGLCKYTGARGKSGSSDATAEVVAYVRRVLDDALARRGIELYPVLEISRPDLICRLLENSEMVSFLPDFITARKVAEGALVRLNVTDMQIDVWQQLIYHRSKWISRSLQTFIDYVAEHEFNR
jgi:hypothetical protein